MSFSEAELQAWLESAVEGETLVDAIDASVLKETTNAAAFEASFGPDFLLRSKLLGAARLVMSSLHGAEIVSHSRNNISMTKGERLFPDLVLVDRESAPRCSAKRSRTSSAERARCSSCCASMPVRVRRWTRSARWTKRPSCRSPMRTR